LESLPHNTALLVIDVQIGFDDPAWGPRNNPQAEANIAALIAAWRAAGAPVIHVVHDSPAPSGLLRPATPGNVQKPEARPRGGERVYRKTVNSAFIGTCLEADLHALGVGTLVIVGLTTNHCVSTTARMAGNLGFETFVVADATATFDRANRDGTIRRAADVHEAALSDLQDEFARIIDTQWAIAAMPPRKSGASVRHPDEPIVYDFRIRTIAAALIATALAIAGPAVDRAHGASGNAGVDTSVRPGDDFYGYANNGWIAATRLPDGMSRLDQSALLRAENARRVRTLVESASSAATRPDERKIADYYASRLDRTAIGAKGYAPIADDLATIAAITDRRALAVFLGRTTRLDDGTNQQTESLWGVWVHQSFHDPDRYAAHLVQGGLGMDRDDYLAPATEADTRRSLYRDHVAAVLKLAGIDQPSARAARVLDLEIAIARTHASRADTDDVYKTDNSWRRADFIARAPGIDWPAYLSAAGFDRAPTFVVWQPGAVIGGAALVGSYPLDAWKDYLSFHLIDHYADVLPQGVGDQRTAFEARLSGASPASPAPKDQALAATEAAFGDVIGHLYVERYFPPRAKAAANDMVENIRVAFPAHLARLAWMSPATRAKAMAKLAMLRIGLGYPATWIDYAPLVVSRGDAIGNVRRVEAFAYRRDIAKLGRPVDPDEWPAQLHPQMVGAILNISPNTMQFAAGLLQPPYFDPAGDAAANYGSAGAGIAHEITHSFDELGSQYDARGNLVRWWTKADVARYQAVAAPLAAQLDRCTSAPDLRVNGKQVLAESAADLAGLGVAYDAYHRSLRGRPDVVRNGLTGDQRFFIAFARRWRVLQTDAALRRQIATDSHAPGMCRSGLVRNTDAWTRTFGVKRGDRLYLEPEMRVRIW
jgi:predicted metalloendopeptidase/nicotinamidase-related amidase